MGTLIISHNSLISRLLDKNLQFVHELFPGRFEPALYRSLFTNFQGSNYFAYARMYILYICFHVNSSHLAKLY